MATNLQINGFYACKIWCLQAEQAAVNTIYYLVTGLTGTAVQDVDLARVVENDVHNLYKAVQSPDVSFRGVTVSQINASAAVGATVSSNVWVGPGSGVGPDMPRQVSGLIEWSTPLAGRRYRGHLYFPFMTAGQAQTNGIPIAGFQGNMVSLATALLNRTIVSNVPATGNATVQLTLHHRAGKSPTPLATQITGFVCPAKFATQKRRGSYGRPNGSPL